MLQPGSYLSFDVVLSQYPALPPLQQLRQHVAWHIREKNTLPPEFSLVGTARYKPYSFDDDEEEDEEQQELSTEDGQKADKEAKEKQQEDAKEPQPDDSTQKQEPESNEAKKAKKGKQGGVFATIVSAFKKVGRMWRTWRDYLDVSSGNIATLTAGIPPHYRWVCLVRCTCRRDHG